MRESLSGAEPGGFQGWPHFRHLNINVSSTLASAETDPSVAHCSHAVGIIEKEPPLVWIPIAIATKTTDTFRGHTGATTLSAVSERLLISRGGMTVTSPANTDNELGCRVESPPGASSGSCSAHP